MGKSVKGREEREDKKRRDGRWKWKSEKRKIEE